MKYFILIFSLLLLPSCVFTTGTTYNRSERTHFIKAQDLKEIKINDDWSFEHGVGYNIYKTKGHVLPGIDYTSQFNWKMLFVGAGVGYTYQGDKVDGLELPYHDIFFCGLKWKIWKIDFKGGFYHESWLYKRHDGINAPFIGGNWSF